MPTLPAEGGPSSQEMDEAEDRLYGRNHRGVELLPELTFRESRLGLSRLWLFAGKLRKGKMSTRGNESMRIQQVAQFRRLWPIGLVAAAGATVANVVFFFVSKEIGIPYLVTMQGSLGPLPPVMVIVSSVIPAVAATVLFALLGKFLSRPIRVFTIISIIVLLISLAPPLTMPGEVAVSTKVSLVVMHIITAAVTVGVLTRLGRVN